MKSVHDILTLVWLTPRDGANHNHGNVDSSDVGAGSPAPPHHPSQSVYTHNKNLGSALFLSKVEYWIWMALNEHQHCTKKYIKICAQSDSKIHEGLKKNF